MTKPIPIHINKKHYTDKDILFIHIPKTGGTSIRHLINDNIPKKFHFGHDPLFSFKIDEVKNKFKFAVVRNPYTRTYSYYHHFCIQNDVKIDFEDFLKEMKEGVFYENTPMYYFPQSFYVYDYEGHFSMDKIYKYEKLYDLENDFSIVLPNLNSGNYKKSDFINDYTPKCINMVKKIFFVDFLKFDYSFNFDLCHE
jgi:hypothetical protein